MLSFELVNSGRAIQILCDDAGAATLMGALQKIKSPKGGHVHLLTPANGGRELNERTPHGDETIGEVIITWAGN